jgi:hypothetical protein
MAFPSEVQLVRSGSRLEDKAEKEIIAVDPVTGEQRTAAPLLKLKHCIWRNPKID